MTGSRGRSPQHPATVWMSAVARALQAESDRYFLWVPVCFGAGIALYFALSREPSPIVAVSVVLAGIGSVALVRGRPVLGTLGTGLLIAALGFANAKLRAVMIDAPMLARATGPVTVTGWIERVEPRLPAGHRVTIRVRRIARQPAAATPFRVRIAARSAGTPPPTGQAVDVRAILRPVPEPVRPGGFDFARKAWFSRLGAVGFAVSGFTASTEPAGAPLDLRLRAAIDRLRLAVAGRIAASLEGESGAIAMALITGERGRIPEATLQAMRHSGLAHVLAISGLHMAMIAGALYWLARAAMAAVPALALRRPIKKWAAVTAILGGFFYLALSGAGIATQRAFLMISIFFLAILLDRPALTLRNVALAACVLLLLFPESLFDVSFQMSFAAVTALVAVYEETSRRTRNERPRSASGYLLFKGTRYMGGIALTTLVASLAVAPFAAFHFHKLAQYGLIANLAAMPIVGLVVMPMALATLLAMPFGLEALPLAVMAKGLEALVSVAKTVSALDGAVVHVAAMPGASLALLALGGLWLALWRGRWRTAGLVFAAAGLAQATTLPRPDVLIDRDGKAFAVRSGAGRLETSSAGGGRYSIEKWRLADGVSEVTGEGDNTARTSRCDVLACIARVRGKTVAFVRHPAALHEECRQADIVVSLVPVRGRCPKARVIVDRFDLWSDGAHAIYLDGQSIRTETVAAWRGQRPWVRTRRKPERPWSGTRAVAEELPDADGSNAP